MTYHKMQATPKEQGDPPSQNHASGAQAPGSTPQTRFHQLSPGSHSRGCCPPLQNSGPGGFSQGHHPELGIGQMTQRPSKPWHYYVVTVTSPASPTAFLTWGQACPRSALQERSPSLGHPLGPGPWCLPQLLQKGPGGLSPHCKGPGWSFQGKGGGGRVGGGPTLTQVSVYAVTIVTGKSLHPRP